MKVNTINTLVSGASTIGEAAESAATRYHEELEATIQGKNVIEISVSHTAGFVLGQGAFFSILASIRYS